jgi:hypothetical protein
LETTGKAKQILATHVKIIKKWTTITKLVIKYYRKDGILHKSESIWKKEPWTITTVHMKGTIRIQCGTKLERINIWRVTPFSEEQLN